MSVHLETRSINLVDFSYEWISPVTNRFQHTPSHRVHKRRRTIDKPEFIQEAAIEFYSVGAKQNALLLHGLKQKYSLSTEHAVPEIKNGHEVLIRVQYIGLNPIDWKAPDYGFGIPTLPYVAGRDLVGVVVRGPQDRSRIKQGDVVFCASTDYRDLRKAAYQEFVVASDYNVCRVPDNVPKASLAGLGVAFVAAALGLGVCIGCDFSKIIGSGQGPNLLKTLRSVNEESIPEDVRRECLQGISEAEIPKKGDWLAIWGGSSATARILAQLCRLAGLKSILVVDVAKHGELLSQGEADLIVDSHDPERAVEIIRRVTRNNLRFAVDTIGKQTAELLERTLRQGEGLETRSHLVGMSGLPKTEALGVKHHVVPVKIHHTVRAVGESLLTWLEGLLANSSLKPIETEVVPGGLEGINGALDRMREGKISGKRLVVKLEK